MMAVAADQNYRLPSTLKQEISAFYRSMIPQ